MVTASASLATATATLVEEVLRTARRAAQTLMLPSSSQPEPSASTNVILHQWESTSPAYLAKHLAAPVSTRLTNARLAPRVCF
jgi:hypothetical protein